MKRLGQIAAVVMWAFAALFLVVATRFLASGAAAGPVAIIYGNAIVCGACGGLTWAMARLNG